MECLKQTPQDAGTAALAAYLDYLALERHVSASTQKQALNAMVFLTKKVFGVEEFAIDKPTHGHTYRRPPVVLSRREVTAVLAHLDNPWKLAAQLMFGSGLRLMECLRLRAKDFDFDHGTITIHDGKGGKHRVVSASYADTFRTAARIAALWAGNIIACRHTPAYLLWSKEGVLEWWSIGVMRKRV